ncbi:hypothetical protein [Sphingobium sp. Z007]|uniref:hypothetical protein n=1 Tax=Sphingobium sp. Z007 TaxID=627495 RepID=UPI001124E67E|nr:hypothetical protein [Sphingobium sp. Z007]
MDQAFLMVRPTFLVRHISTDEIDKALTAAMETTMRLLGLLGQGLARLRESARREFLRDPDVILFERQAKPAREAVHGR